MQIDNIPYLWEKSKRRKHMALLIDDNGVLTIRTPLRTSKRTVEALILEKKIWIEKSQQKQRERIHPKFPEFSSQGRLYHLGQVYDFYCEDKKPYGVEIKNDKVLIQVKSETHFTKLLHRWYKETTQTLVHEFIGEFENKLTTQVSSVGFRYYKRRWGSCSSKNGLMFNSLLSLHAKEHIKYVVAHELAHIKEKNHSKDFYAEGERILNGFRNLNKTMRS